MLSFATAADVAVNVAVPFDSVPTPSVVLPFRNVTVPPGTPAVELTNAVIVADVPAATEEEDRLIEVVVGIAVTAIGTIALVEPALFGSPRYTAEILCVPGPFS